MRLLIQRVLEASVSVSEAQVSSIGKGLLVLLGINQKDDYKLAEKMAKKLVKLRLWPETPDPCQIQELKRKEGKEEAREEGAKEEIKEEIGEKGMAKGRELKEEKKQEEREEKKECVEKEHTQDEAEILQKNNIHLPNSATKLPKNKNNSESILANIQNESSSAQEPSSLKTWDKSVKDLGYEILVVSQFTLYGVLKGNKPDFHNSMGADEARKIFEFFVGKVEEEIGREKVGRGRFQEHMHVALVNDGPVTLVWDEEKEEKGGKK